MNGENTEDSLGDHGRGRQTLQQTTDTASDARHTTNGIVNTSRDEQALEYLHKDEEDTVVDYNRWVAYVFNADVFVYWEYPY